VSFTPLEPSGNQDGFPFWSARACSSQQVRFGTRYGIDLKLEDSLAAALVDQNPGGKPTAMGSEFMSPQHNAPRSGDMADFVVTAENLAKKYGITRDECDGEPGESLHKTHPC
jgi:hypothetical protein